jgi:hypothetical protein
MHPGRETSTHYLSCSGSARLGFIKKCTGTHHAEPVFLHPMRSAHQVVNSGVSGP